MQVVLLGVCVGSGASGIDPLSEISLQPLAECTIPSDSVTMTCVASTESGRIFLGGKDGHLYEVQYRGGSGWQRRCSKVCHTGSLGGALAR